ELQEKKTVIPIGDLCDSPTFHSFFSIPLPKSPPSRSPPFRSPPSRSLPSQSPPS
ncbi:928_t:CDS:1, partial [Gigaspora rosea]